MMVGPRETRMHPFLFYTLAAAASAVAVVALVGLAGVIIFADVKNPMP